MAKQRDSVAIVDVRDAEQFELYHVAGAVSKPGASAGDVIDATAAKPVVLIVASTDETAAKLAGEVDRKKPRVGCALFERRSTQLVPDLCGALCLCSMRSRRLTGGMRPCKPLASSSTKAKAPRTRWLRPLASSPTLATHLPNSKERRRPRAPARRRRSQADAAEQTPVLPLRFAPLLFTPHERARFRRLRPDVRPYLRTPTTCSTASCLLAPTVRWRKLAVDLLGSDVSDCA